MFYKNELSYLCDILQKCHVDAAPMDLREYVKLLDGDDFFSSNAFLKEQVQSFKTGSVYKITDHYGLCYRFLLLPDTDFETIFKVGPYLSAPTPPDKLWEIGETNGISPHKQRYLAEYYSSIPVIPPDSPLWTAFNSFCERIWKISSFPIIEITPDKAKSPDVGAKTLSQSDSADTLLNIKAMERRYVFENQLIRAVERGQLHMVNQLHSAFSANLFEKRVADPLRNAQNYTIIMNTLLRKAAERGGVHPFHIDRVSSAIAIKIESMSSIAQTQELMTEIFCTYCELVREKSMKELPPIVKQTVMIIESDLSADLSPSLLASHQGVSLGYLSSIFKKATDQTISEYVRQKRMEYAAYLLRNTNLQVQTVALHNGIMDVQYFSKLFKRQIGMTPTEYRLSKKG